MVDHRNGYGRRPADDRSGATRGLRQLAGIAVGMIFGPTADTSSDGAFGGDPWSAKTLDPDELGDVVEPLEDTVAALSDLGEFGREFEHRIVAIGGAGPRMTPPGTLAPSRTRT